MNFEKLDARELASIGIRFSTEEETHAFVEIIMYELEVRIGEEISRHVSEEQLQEFDRCSSQTEITSWLTKNYPDYWLVVQAKMDELEKEILDYRDQIPGVIPCSQKDAEKTERRPKNLICESPIDSKRDDYLQEQFNSLLEQVKRMNV